jgi:hypothetical protein
VRQAEPRRKCSLERAGVAAGGEPHVERCVEKIAQVARVENLAGAGDVSLSGYECLAGLALGEKFFPERQDLLAQRV